MRYTIRWRYVLKVAAVVAVLAAVVVVAHHVQAGAQPDAILRRADKAKEANDAAAEAKFLNMYLAARPDDRDARERFGRLMLGLARTRTEQSEAFLTLEDVLRQAPDRDELRRFMADQAASPRYRFYPQAGRQYAELIKKHKDDAGLEVAYARCLTAEGKFAEAADHYQEAARKQPDLVDAYAGQAALLRLRLAKPEDADRAVAGMLAANPQNPKALLAVAQYWRTFGGRRQPAAAVARAVAEAQKLPPGEAVGGAVGRLAAEVRRLAPDDLDGLLLAAADLQDQARDAAEAGKKEDFDRAVKEARELLAAAVKGHPKAAAAYLAAAGLEAKFTGPAAAAEKARAGAEALPDSVALADALLEFQLLAGDAAGADATFARLKAAGASETRLAVPKARIQGLRDEWEAAAAGLAAVLAKNPPELTDDPAFARQLNLVYAACCAQLGEHDRRLKAARAAVPADPADPKWADAQWAVADALVAQGKADEALVLLRRMKDRAPGVVVPIAKMELVKALQAPEGQRDWAALDEALAEAAKRFGGLTDVRIMAAVATHHKGDPAAARKQLDALTAERPKEAAGWVAAAFQDLRDENPDRALKTLDAGAAAAGDSAELRLARAQVYAEAKDPDLGGKLLKLADGADTLGKAGQRRLLRGLAEVASAHGAGGAAGLWKQAAGAHGHNLGVHLARYDAAAKAGDEGAMAEAAAAVRQVDGADGQYARLVAGMLAVWKAGHDKKDKAELEAARVGLEAALKDRPDWAKGSFVLALVLDAEGKPDEALVRYQKAVDDGETNPAAAAKLAALLTTRGKLAEAEAVFKKLPPAYAGRPELAGLEATLMAKSNPRKALERAEQAVGKDNKDPKNWLWVGQLAWAAREPGKAEAAVRKAIDLDKTQPGPWLSLARILAAGGKTAEAEKAVAEGAAAIAPAGRPLFAAQAAVELGKLDDAAARFKDARQASPGDFRTLQAEADFLFKLGRLADARDAFQRVVDLKDRLTEDDRQFAKRMLAICLAADRDPRTSRRALELLGLVEGEGLKDPPNETPAQRKTRATVLALQKDRASKLKAVELLEGQMDTLDPAELYTLAQLQQAVGNRPQVRVAMAALLRKAENVPLYLAWYAAWLLKQDDPGAAAPLVDRLAKLQPASAQTAELRARLLAAQKKPEEARKVLQERADQPGAPTVLYARLFEEVGLHDDAEKLYRKAAADNKAAQPGVLLPLAVYLGRRGQTAAALEEVDAARGLKVPAPAWGAAAVSVLYAAKTPSKDDMARAAGWLDEAMKAATGPAKAVLAQQLASVRNLQGDYPSATELYRRAIAENERDVIALNNLAYLEAAADRQFDEALKRIDRAKAAAGEVPDLQDTKALILILSGRPGAAQEAVRLMKAVTAEAPTGTAFFHLAQAELAAGNKTEAAAAWRDAGKLGLTRAELHPLERAEYDRLAADGAFR